MKFVKVVEEKEVIIECDNPNLYSLYKREGFEEVKEKKKLEK